jgi:hypothetical protein
LESSNRLGELTFREASGVGAPLMVLALCSGIVRFYQLSAK